MAGFMSIALIGEHYGQAIVNTFWYRSVDWDPLFGQNPFADGLKVIDDFLTNCKAEYLAVHNNHYTLLRAEGTIYKDDFTIVNSSPIQRDIGQAGVLGNLAEETTGSSVAANISFVVGIQHQINGIGQSPRNRGYLSIGPVPEALVDNYGHLADGYVTDLGALAAKLDDTLLDVIVTASFVPIRIHEKWVKAPITNDRILVYRTYSDIIGYRVRRVATWRRSRMPEE